MFFSFLTFTGNSNWPEIQEALRNEDGTTEPWESRPDIVCRIFFDKMEEFLKDITERHVLGKCVAWCYSLEHQKRGNFLIFDLI